MSSRLFLLAAFCVSQRCASVWKSALQQSHYSNLSRGYEHCVLLLGHNFKCSYYCLCLLIDCDWLGLDPPPQHGADNRNLVLLPGWKADQHYQELADGRASGQWKINLLYNQMSFWQLITVQHCLSAVKRVVWSFAECVLVTLNINDDELWAFISVVLLNLYEKHEP